MEGSLSAPILIALGKSVTLTGRDIQTVRYPVVFGQVPGVGAVTLTEAHGLSFPVPLTTKQRLTFFAAIGRANVDEENLALT